MNEWILLQEGAVIYALLFVLLLAGAIGFPMPEDVPLVLGGVLAQMGKADLWFTAIVLLRGNNFERCYYFLRWLEARPSNFSKEVD